MAVHLPAGDPKVGREVFAKPECYTCHKVNGEKFPLGSKESNDSGPELAWMGTHHPAEYFADSILNPNAVIVTGPRYTGPDGLSVMPDYRDSLTVTELIDLVAYLKSLDGEQRNPCHRKQTPSDHSHGSHGTSGLHKGH